ncbi:MAG TPA: hypothetical protein VMF62_13455 [Acetobacteraceae bacterium]|nr:hypothetical protein [Acetobacteraceae bacterium]
MPDFDIAGFAAELGRMSVRAATAVEEALERAAVIVEKEAKREIGHYQQAAGRFPAWPKLKPATIAEKMREGYAPPDNPLKRSGWMRASIEHQVHAEALSGEAQIGSNDPVAEYQEEGTERMDARSFLGRAAVRKEEEVVGLLGEAVAVALGATRIR